MKWLLFCPQDELEQLQASVPADSGPSLQSMGLLLDRLAKENQDIRLLQAQLQVGPGKREGVLWPPLPEGVFPARLSLEPHPHHHSQGVVRVFSLFPCRLLRTGRAGVLAYVAGHL